MMRTCIHPLSKEKVLVRKAFLAEIVEHLNNHPQLAHKVWELIEAKDVIEELKNDLYGIYQYLTDEDELEVKALDVDEVHTILDSYAKR